jgi:hypothetical protein
LADPIGQQRHGRESPDQVARAFLSEQVATVEEALAGARDIVAEAISDHPAVRRLTRERALHWAVLRCARIEKTEDPRGVYQTYYAFEAPVGRLKPYQVLAIDRGEAEKVLRVAVEVPERDGGRRSPRPSVRPARPSLSTSPGGVDAAERLLLPAIERDVRRHLSQQARHTPSASLPPSARAADPAAARWPDGTRLDPRLSHRLQGRRRRSDRPAARHGPSASHEPQRQREEALPTLSSWAPSRCSWRLERHRLARDKHLVAELIGRGVQAGLAT